LQTAEPGENAEMPKIRSNRSACKRFRLTGTGKVRRSKAFKSHILTKKPRKRKRNLRHGTLVDAANEPKVKRMIPYK
jgi:large subunit ribosomal protein L35